MYHCCRRIHGEQPQLDPVRGNKCNAARCKKVCDGFKVNKHNESAIYEMVCRGNLYGYETYCNSYDDSTGIPRCFHYYFFFSHELPEVLK